MPPKVLTYMSSPVIAAKPTDNIAHIRNLMLRHDIGSIVIINGRKKPIGIVTKRDLLKIALSRKWYTRPIDRIPVMEIMSKPTLISLYASIKRAAQIMLKKDIWALPVVDAEEKLVGIITRTDITRAYAEKYYGKAKVKEYMDKNPPVASPTHTLYYIGELLATTNIGRIIIVDGEKPVGIITETDIAFIETPFVYLGDKPFRKRPGISPRGKYAMLRYYVVPLTSDIMTTNLITIEPEADLAEAADAMIKNGISSLPVVTQDRLIGILTKSCILKALIEVS